MSLPMTAFATAVLLTASTPCGSAAESENSFAIHNVRVFDGRAVIRRATVIVRNGRIEAVDGGAAIPEGMDVINGSGKTLLPGFIDSHIHVFPGAQGDALRFGVTTELDMFNLSHDFTRWRSQRESLARVMEADTWSAGTGITVPGGHPNQWVPEDMPRLHPGDDVAAFVAARNTEGSDYIKLILENNAALDPARPFPTLSTEQVCAAAAASRARGLLSIVHATQQVDAHIAIDCGANGLAHMFEDSVASESFVRLAEARRTFVVTTLSVVAAASGAPTAGEVLKRPDVASLLSAGQERSLRATFDKPHPTHINYALDSVRRLHVGGVVLLAGTDAPAPGTAHGVSMHQELALLVRAGLKPADALAAATASPATIFHLDDRGRILPGHRADLILVDGDPTKSISDTLRIERIWKNGYPVKRALP